MIHSRSGFAPVILRKHRGGSGLSSRPLGSAPVTLRWYELVYPSGGVLVDAMSVLPATPVALGTTPS